MLLLPVYLGLLLGNDAATLVRPGPFVHAFVWLIAVRQTLIELLSEVVYVRVIARLGGPDPVVP